MSARRASRSPVLGALCASLALASWACAGSDADAASALTGDWDYWRMLGARPSGGFEARRRFGFAHFEGADPAAARLERRAGGTLETVVGIAVTGDSLVLDFASGAALRAQVLGDTIAGVLVRGGAPADRVWLVRRSTPPAYEPYHPLWPGQVSDSMYPVEIDPAVPMTARDGTTLMSFVARPAGQGPFPVVMERTPYLRVDTANGVFWASRGYLYVKQDVRGRGGSDGVLDMNALQEQDGYDAVEWAAALPASSGKVGMVGRSNPGLYTWYAAIAQPPHLTTIAPVVATADPLRLVPYIDMVFSPTIVPWLCYTAVRETLSDLSAVDLVPAFNHLPVIESAERAGCPRPQFWDDWFDHQQEDDYWRSLSIEGRLDRVLVPVLGIAGWYDDARGNLRNFVGLDTLPGHPFQRVVMDPGAHKGIDYVNGDFGPQARLDHRALQLRWFDHWLKGMDNGVDREPPLDLFIMGENRWRQEHEWPLARTLFTRFYFHSGGAANTTAGDGTLDTIPPGAEPEDAYTYDPGDPTPYLMDARELELNINEDYAAVHAARQDALVYTTPPLAQATEITGPMTATLWAATDARDTDWNVMILQVRPDGSAWRIQDGVVRARFRDGFDRPSLLTPGEVYRYDLDVWFTALVVPAGDRIRVVVTSAAFPKYDRNLNTGGDNERDTTFVPARQRVLHDAEHPSHVTLPLIPRTGG
ncbi:MAG: CocE/NonD family hydrolase [Longimicrobiales bacterium]|nr:CocE/NonD family hydrolase [Longimicrobiales bacterium]